MSRSRKPPAKKASHELRSGIGPGRLLVSCDGWLVEARVIKDDKWTCGRCGGEVTVVR